MFLINDQKSFEEFKSYIVNDKPKIISIKDNIVETEDCKVKIENEYLNLLNVLKPKYDKLIYGKDSTENIVSISVKDNKILLYKKDGTIETRDNIYWILSANKLTKKSIPLEGKQTYKFINTFKTKNEFKRSNKSWYKKETYCIWNEVEAAMVYHGITQFKGMQISDISVLSFDIEAEGLKRHEDSDVYLITNTFRSNTGKITKKHFRVDHYENAGEMIVDWSNWVREVNPDIITGHNIYGYDLPYINHVASLYNKTVNIGRDESPMIFNPKPSNFRVDGNTTWEYHKCHIEGREIIDGMFLAVKYDIGRNYPSWGLKSIAEYEGFVKEDRQFYDASKIAQNWSDPVEREKIVQYGIDDSDDSLAIFDLMAPSIFYMTQSVPKPFQIMGTSASGSQLNAVMVRAYLQDGHSIPKASEGEYVAGGMSYGIPGVYENVSKWDAKSYYPSTILAFNIYDKHKDPKAYFLKMVKHFTYKRFEQKDKYKETKNKYYNDMQAASKIFINSAYGLLGTKGLNFNSFSNAQKITKCCRAGLQKAVIWATGKDINYWWAEYSKSETSTQDFQDFSVIDQKVKILFDDMPRHNWKLVNLDTDSLSFSKQDGSSYSEEEYNMIYEQINGIMYSDWEDDGQFDKVLVSRAKNYVLVEDGKVKYKGSSLTDSKKEVALREMLDSLINDILFNNSELLLDIYNKYIKEAVNIEDISRWCTKKSISAKVLNPSRTNEQKILDAVKHLSPREGDKYLLYSAVDGEVQDVKKGEPVFFKNGTPKMIPNKILKTESDWNGDEDKEHYIKRVYKTLEILKNVVDMDQFIKYHLKSNIHKIKEL